MKDVIDRFDGDFSFLSNFYPVNVVYEGKVYPSTEHAYQAAKTLDEQKRDMIARLPLAAAAKKVGKSVELRPDWSKVRDQVMFDVCWAKFTQPKMSEMLLSTGNAPLVEGNWWHDTYWGVCNGVGKNKLGETLMQIRNLLKSGVK